MFKSTKTWVWTKAFLDRLWTMLNTTDNDPPVTLEGSVLHGWANEPELSGLQTQLVGFTENAFDGYAAADILAGDSTVAVGSIVQSPLLVTPNILGGVATVMFASTADQDEPGEQIKGVYLTNNFGTELWGYEDFGESPVPILFDGDFLQYDLILPIPGEVGIS